MNKQCLIKYQIKKEEDVMKSKLRIIRVALLGVLLAVFLTGCGGGAASSGGGTTTTTIGPTAPSAPTGVSATAGNGQATISWSAVSGATSYNIYWSKTSGVTKANGTKITGATSPYTHTSLTNGSTYYYIVTAVNSSGESVESAQVSATPTGGGVWNIETVLPAGAVGEYPSLAIDNTGNPHISYLDYNDGYVKYAFKNGTSWSINNVGYVANSYGTIANGGLSSIALDAANNPHICYFDYGNDQFKYAQKVGASWTTTIISLPDDPLMSYSSPFIPWAESSIAVNKTTGTASISLQMLGGLSGYVLGYWKPGLGNAVIVDSGDRDSGWHNAIALDGNGFPNISYEARGAGNLKYAHWNGSAFNLEIVTPMPSVYWEDRLTSLAIDNNNNPHIAYIAYLDGYKHAYKNGSSWTIEAIPYNSGYPALSLSLDGTGKPHLALVGGSLKHAYWNGSSWSFDIIEDNVVRCVIAVDNSGKIHMGYNTDISGTSIIKYASK
jgi:fibronectin type 3 domain-containing protein